jgi:hypothetical protein
VLAANAFAAPPPFKEIPATATQTAKDAIAKPERCIQATTIQRFMVKPDGAVREIAKVTMWTACK